MGNFILNAILFGIIYTDKGKQLANEVVNLVVEQAKYMLGTPNIKETQDG